jgi:hypothetical protein
MPVRIIGAAGATVEERPFKGRVTSSEKKGFSPGFVVKVRQIERDKYATNNT